MDIEKRKAIVKKELIKELLAVVLGVAVFLVFMNIYYHAQPDSMRVAGEMTHKNGDLYFYSASKKGIIIYSGAKVEEESYSLLAKALHEKGYNVAIPRMLFKFAIFSGDRANDVITANPQIDEWIIAGHSLGATAASIYLYFQRPPKVKGLVFMGAYPYKDLSSLNIFCLSIYGENDGVMSRDDPFKPSAYYPKNTVFEIIKGGNHVFFGDYGRAPDNAVPGISMREQIDITANLIDKAAGGS